MHIAHLETGRNLYGGARQVLMLLEGLAEQGVQTTLFCPIGSAIAAAADPAHTRIVTMPVHGDLDVLFSFRLADLLAGCDLLHVHSRRGADLWGALAAWRAKVPAVLSRRVDNREPMPMSYFKYRRFARIIAISNAIGRQLQADGVAEEKLRIVRSALAADSCEPHWSREQFLQAFDYTEDNLVVVSVAQLIPRKGHADLLEAWARAVADYPQARLLIFGQGKERAALEHKARAAGIADTVQFAGFRADLREFLGCADVFVHPAHAEGLGVALLEAQAAGLPVVATEAGGIPEAVKADATMQLVPPGNPDALAGALRAVFSDAGLRERLGTAGQQFIRSEFPPQQMVLGNLAVYQELLDA